MKLYVSLRECQILEESLREYLSILASSNPIVPYGYYVYDEREREIVGMATNYPTTTFRQRISIIIHISTGRHDDND